MATDMSDQGNYEQALRILSQLHDAQKISMRETATQNVSAAISFVNNYLNSKFGEPQDLTFMQQQKPQNEIGVQETPGHKWMVMFEARLGTHYKLPWKWSESDLKQHF